MGCFGTSSSSSGKRKKPRAQSNQNNNNNHSTARKIIQVSPAVPPPQPLNNANNNVEEYEEESSPTQKQRKCRDVICLGFLSASVFLMCAICIYSIASGSLSRLIHMVDSTNCDECGVPNPPLAGIPNSGQDQSSFPYVISLKRDGSYDKTFHYFLPDESLEYVTQCRASCPVEFKAIINRCVALKTDVVPNAKEPGVINDVSTFFSELAADFERSWPDVLWMCLIALGISLIMTALLRLFAGIIIWVVVIGVSLAAIGASITLWVLWTTNKADYNNGKGPTKTEVTGWLIAAIVSTVLTLILLILLLFMRKRIALVIRLFNEAGKAIHTMPLILAQPIITFAALSIALGAWLVVLILIESAGDPQMVPLQNGDGQSVCVYKKNGFLLFSRWWNLFMIAWITQFIVGCQHLIIAGAVSIWFFTRNKSNLDSPIFTSMKNLVRYHMGSIAFGALIIAIVKIIRYILNAIQNRLGGDNAFCKGVLCCCKCCIWCLENFLIFLNRNAYIEIAIHGKGFCSSAKKAFQVLVNNALRVAAINSIGDFVLILAKLAIVAATVLCGYYIVKNREEVNNLWVPLTIGGICSYFIAHCFISVYEMAIDTVFICFCEDCDMNDGVSKPYYMSKGLMEFVKNSQKALKAKNERTTGGSTRSQ